MSKCLTDARIRAAADSEETEIDRRHLEACEACRERLDAARRANDELSGMTAGVTVPDSLRGSVERAIARRGATVLRDVPSSPWRWRLWATAGAVAAAVLLVFLALPTVDAPRALSAAEILDRSLQKFAPASGVELREFDLELQLPRVASVQNGTYRIEELIDHDTPGRHRIVRYAPDGTLVGGISEDPAAGRRTAVVRVDTRQFAFRFAIDPGRTLGLRDLERSHVEATIRILQAAAGQTVREVDTGAGKRYVIELPPVADRGASGFWALDRARVVIDAADHQIRELAVAGSYMGEPFSVSFRLRRRELKPAGEVPADRFDVPIDPDAIVIEGPGTEDFGHDLLMGALRELERSKN
jgi:hypothetical protein